jgi:hypothetical protein
VERSQGVAIPNATLEFGGAVGPGEGLEALAIEAFTVIADAGIGQRRRQLAARLAQRGQRGPESARTSGSASLRCSINLSTTRLSPISPSARAADCLTPASLSASAEIKRSTTLTIRCLCSAAIADAFTAA